MKERNDLFLSIVRQGIVGSQTVFTRPIERQHVCDLSARGRVYETLVKSALKEFGNWPSTGTSGATGSARSKNYRHVAACFLRRARLPFARNEKKHADTRVQLVQLRPGSCNAGSNGGVSNERQKRKGWSSGGSQCDRIAANECQQSKRRLKPETKKRSSAD